tara:strand:- start:51 stop:725 length:675 start_codon:yes stop_codon:yes gene_type:complete
MNIAIIPAKSNSVRIKNKNIKLFMGKPIIFWSIRSALNCKVFDKIIVSTDDKKIAKLVKKYGAEVPFIRPKKLADNKTEILHVMKHAVKKISKKNDKIKYICCIFAAAPMIKYQNILKAFKVLKKRKCDFVFPVCENSDGIARSFFIKNKKINMLNKSFYHYRSQDLPKTYYDSGQFYWARKNTWLKSKKIFTKNSKMLVVPADESIDINNIKDWNRALKLFKK